MNLINQLKKSPSLETVPDDQLQWLIDHSEMRHVKEEGFLFQKGEPADHMLIVLEGRAKVYILQNSQRREMFELEPPDITGLLPFSRLKVAMASAQAVVPLKVLATSREVLRDLVCTHYELTEKLVHEMTSRVRDFTSAQRQDEKMLALGKLSAGLAHELNNPAAAIVRSSDELKKHLSYTPDRFKRVITMKIEPEQVDAVNNILYAKALEGRKNTGLKERNRLEEEILDWFDDNDLERGDDLAENFIEYGIGPSDLDKVKAYIPAEELAPVLAWLDNVLTTEKMVSDIHEASKRISKLVQSVKSYSHMDRGLEKELVDISTGIRDTLNLLAHKFKKAGITVREDYATDLPRISILPGQINQVWTNLIDNAIDALEGVTDPVLEIKAFKEREFVKVSITDNGPGIPDEVLGKIYDPFFTTKEVGKGSGLGLEIVQGIVKQHNGSVNVSTKPGTTTFTVCIPA